VENVGAGGRHTDLQGVAGGLRKDENAHLFGAFSNLGAINVYAQKTIDVTKFNFEVKVLHSGGDLVLLRLIFISDLDLLNSVLVFGGAVFTELGGEDGKADLGLSEVGTSDLYENVLSCESDFSLLRVDNGGQREHLAVFVEKYGVARVSF
jgi:hypothetical protein